MAPRIKCAYCYDDVDRPKTCGQCKSRVYCSKECQTDDWKGGHKVYCGKSGELNVDFEVKPSPGKGLGVFAKRPFKKYEVVMVERTFDTTAIPTLTGSEKEAYWELSPGPDWHWKQRFPPDVVIGPEIEWMRIIAINGIRTNKGPVVCINISRINHACPGANNCDYRENSGKNLLVVNAHRDIAAGEEITFTYVPMWDKSGLMRNFGITCDCECCKNPARQSLIDQLYVLETGLQDTSASKLHRICMGIRALFLMDEIQINSGEYLSFISDFYYLCKDTYPAVAQAFKKYFIELRKTLLVDEEA